MASRRLWPASTIAPAVAVREEGSVTSWPRSKVAAVVKIQIPAGKATPAPPVGTALGPHGVAIMDFCKQYNAATESQTGTIVPVEITVFEDRTFTFVLKTPPTPVLLRQAAGAREGLDRAGQGLGRHDHRGPGRGDRQDQDARPQRLRPRGRQASRCGAPPARWASRSSDPEPTTARPGRPRPAGTTHHEGAIMAKGKKYVDAAKRFDRDQLFSADRGPRAGEEPGRRQVRRDRRAGRAPRRRSPQGRSDRPRHRRPALGHRQGRAGRGVRRRRGRGRGSGGGRRHRRGRRPGRAESRRACSTSTSPSPRPT